MQIKQWVINVSAMIATALISTNLQAEDFNVDVCDLQSHNNSNRAYLRPCENWESKK